MPLRLEVDDTNSVIAYFGEWLALQGSSRQWQSTVHSTTSRDAVVSINFQGTRVVIYCTIPIGSGTEVLASVVLDGQTTSFSHSTNGSAIYANMLFDSGPISDTPHNIALINMGSSSDSPLQLDRFHLEGTVFNVTTPKSFNAIPVGGAPTGGGSTTSQPPVVTSSSTGPGLNNPTSPISESSTPGLSPPTSISSTNPVFQTITDSNGGSEIVSLPQDLRGSVSIVNNVAGLATSIHGKGPSVTFTSYLVTSTRPDGTVITEVVESPIPGFNSPPVHIPRGAVIGCVIGAIMFLVLAIAILLRRRQRHRSTLGHILLPDERTPELTDVTPFYSNGSTEHITEESSTESHSNRYPRNDKSRSSSIGTASHKRHVTAAASTQSLIQPSPDRRLPQLNLEHGHEGQTYVIFPHQYSSSGSASSLQGSVLGSPDTPNSIYSTTGLSMHSVAVLLPIPGDTDELPPSYQASG